MTKKIPIKAKTDKDILLENIEKYQPKDADLTDVLEVSRQRLWLIKRGEGRLSADRLATLGLRSDWIGDMAREMLRLRGLRVVVPVATRIEEAA